MAGSIKAAPGLATKKLAANKRQLVEKLAGCNQNRLATDVYRPLPSCEWPWKTAMSERAGGAVSRIARQHAPGRNLGNQGR